MSEEPRAALFEATFPDAGQPYKVHANGGGVVLLQWPETAYGLITELYRAGRGHRLRVLIEVLPGERVEAA